MNRSSQLALLAFGLVLGVSAAVAAPLPEKFRNPDSVTLDTNHGVIRIKLFPKQAPGTVENFLKYVDAGFYKDTVFHRVIPNFMIQGGGLDADLTEKQTRPPIKNESANGLSNKRGTVVLARTVQPDSGTVQFFINLRDNPALDHQRDQPGYCVFGEVVEGMDVVDAIAKVATGMKGQFQDVPQQAVIIRSIRRGQ
jgi:cyclophilin family peptidyl-prolyl cis-trans isomerase